MHFQALEQSPRNYRNGQVSYLLLGRGQFNSQNMAITWVEGAPGSQQPAHSHPKNEQAFVIVQGRGLMRDGTAAREVGPGSIVFIPPGTDHSIQNIGKEPLVYISATFPPFEMPVSGSTFAYSPPPQ